MKLIYKPGFGVVEGNRAPGGLTDGTTLLSAYDLLGILGFAGARTTSGKNRWKAQGHERTSGMLIGTIINPSDQYYILVELAGDTYSIAPKPAEEAVSRIVVIEDLLTVAKLVYPLEMKGDRYTVTVTYGGHRTVAGFVFPGTVSIEVPKLGWKVLITHEDIRINEDLKEISPVKPPVGVNR